MERRLAVELQAMVDEDQRLRRAVIEAMQSGGQAPDDLVEELRGIDARNTARLREIVAEHGWPGRALVGEAGARDAWLLVQHADHDVAFQREALHLLKAAVDGGEASRVELAYLEDRVRVGEGYGQLYGTQLREADGGFVPLRLEDPEHVDERRAAVGLGSLADYLASYAVRETSEAPRSYGDLAQISRHLVPGGSSPDAGVQAGTVVLGVMSGKGGVGKSTIALNLALALVERGLAVGLLDADLYGPDIPVMVNLKRSSPRDRWMLGRAAEFGGAALEPVNQFGLKLMSIGFLIGEDQSLSMAAPLLRSVLLQLLMNVKWGPLDYLIIDMPPGTADVQQELLDLVDVAGALLVVTPQDAAHLDSRRVLEMLDSSGVEVIGGVENMAGLSCPHCGEPVDVFPHVREERSIWHAGVPRLISMPLDPAVADAADRGHPILLSDPDNLHARPYRELTTAVTGWNKRRGAGRRRGRPVSPWLAESDPAHHTN